MCALLVLVALASTALAQVFPQKPAEPEGPLSLYGFESGIVEYEVKSPTVPGTRTTYFIKKGHLLREETLYDLPNGKQKQEVLIMQGNKIYNVYPEFKKAIVEEGHRGPATIEMEALVQKVGDRDKAVEYLDSQGISFLESEEILGHLCQVWQQDKPEMRGTMWAYKGCPLRILIQRKQGESLLLVEDLVAKRTQFHAEVDPQLFKLTEDYQVMTRQQMQSQQVQSQPKVLAPGAQPQPQAQPQQ